MNLPELPDYRVDELIGEGSFGLVFRCAYRGQEPRAIKYLKAQAINPGLLNSCYRGMSGREKHPGLSEVFEHDFVTHPFYFISPLYGWKNAETGQWVSNTLDRFLGTLEWEDAYQVITQLVAALCFLHRRDAIHAGLKPSNIFVTGKTGNGLQVKIADWGQGYVTGLQYLEMGDLGFYAAPEQLDNGLPGGGAGKRWDVYSFGVVAFQLLTGRLPRLEKRFQEHLKTDFDHVPATAFGSVLESPERYLDWIVAEDGLEWPEPARSDREARLREILARCLALDPRERFSDMRDVETAFAMADRDILVAQLEKKVQETAEKLTRENEEKLSQKQEAAQKNEARLVQKYEDQLAQKQEAAQKNEARLVRKYEDQLAQKGKEKRSSSPRGWRALAIGSMLLFFGAAMAAGILYAKWQNAQGHFQENLTGARESADKVRETMNAAFAELGNQLSQAAANVNEKDAEILAREAARQKLAEDMRSQMRHSREMIREAQENGDGFFEMVLENKHSDVPGYEAKRIERLSEARGYYQSLLAVYGEEEDFIDASAKAARYLGEIYGELGNLAQSAEYFALAEKRLRRVMELNPGGEEDVLRDLAMVRKRQGYLLSQRRDLEPALQALQESSQLWRRLYESNPASQREAIEVGEIFLLEAEIRREMRDTEGRRLVIRSAMETFMALQEANPDQHRVVGGLARATELSARFLADNNQAAEAIETYQQAADLFGRAVRLNAAVDDYQIGLAESLAAIALMKDDPAKLKEAATVLSEVASVPGSLSNGALQKAFSDCYGRLAEQQRDGGNTAEAIQWEQQAGEILRAAMAETRGKESASLVRFALAQRKCHLAELQGDLKNFAESRKTLTEALVLLTALLEADPANPAFRRQYALAQGQMGYATQQTGDLAQARTHYEASRDHWNAFMEAFPDDLQAADAFEWTKRQIASLP